MNISGINNQQDSSSGMMNKNKYATKKTMTQGMLDVALLTFNISQLKFILKTGDEEYENYYPALGILISIIVLQLVAGILFIVLGFGNIDDEKQQKRAERINNAATIVVFVISFMSIVMGGFGIDTPGNSGKD